MLLVAWKRQVLYGQSDHSGLMRIKGPASV